jgi:hypothetical protein
VLYAAYTNNDWRFARVALDSPTVVKPFVQDSVRLVSPSLSPDGKWVMITGVEPSGQAEVCVRVTNRNDYELEIVPNWLPEPRKRLAGGR